MEKSKYQHLKALSNERGVFHILAIDHRDLYDKALSAQMNKTATRADVIQSKREIIKLLHEDVSCVLIDPICALQDGRMNDICGDMPFLMGIENSNYDFSAFSNIYLYPDLSVKKIKELGSDCVKLFVFYHPDLEVCTQIDALIDEVGKACAKVDIPLLLEPILLLKEPVTKAERYDLTMRMLKRLIPYKVDIFKLEYPMDVYEGEEENLQVCKEIDQLIDRPWIILSSGVKMDEFKLQLEYACRSGASGYAAGRSVWQDALWDINDEKAQDLKTNIQELAGIGNTFASPWYNKVK